MTNTELMKLLNEYNSTYKEIESLVLYVNGKFKYNDLDRIEEFKNKINLYKINIEQMCDELDEGINEILCESDVSNNIKRYWVDETSKILVKKSQSVLFFKTLNFLLKSYKDGKIIE